MRRSLYLTFLCVICIAMKSQAQSIPLITVPASTAYCEPDPDSLQVTDSGWMTGWNNNKEHIFWVGDIRSTGNLHLALSLHLPTGISSTLSLSLDRQIHTVKIQGDGSASITADFGSYLISRPGTYRFQVNGIKKSGEGYGDIQSLLVSGPAAQGAKFNLNPAQRGAPSVHLFYTLPRGEQISKFYNEVKVTRSSPIYSYYMACGWQRGYFGIQSNSPAERRIIFSVWDSGKEAVNRSKVSPENRVQMISKGAGVFAGGFGNEGTGLHSHLIYHWKEGETYHFLVTAQPDGTGTIYSGFFYFPEKKEWGLIASFRAPEDGGYMSGLYSFIEDWWGSNGFMRRNADFGPTWISSPKGGWQELTQARFSDTGGKWRTDFSAGEKGDRFTLATGAFLPGNVKYGDMLNRPASQKPPANISLPIITSNPHVQISLNTDAAPDLLGWAEKAKTLAEEWYPKIWRIIPSPDFVPPTHAAIVFKKMDGVAYTSGTTITVSIDYVRSHPNDLGMIIHELTHVVQQYPGYSAGWLVEGIADYVRNYHYENPVRKAFINLKTATYHDAYSTTAAFLAWVTGKFDRNLVEQLDDALRSGDFHLEMFKTLTAKNVEELWTQFTAEIAEGKAKQYVTN